MFMIINETLGIQKVNNSRIKIVTREAVRAVIVKDNKLLMVRTNRGDFKFPGGGIKRLETHEEALIREVKEETGYVIDKIKDKIGLITHRNPNQFDKSGIFQMISHYYLCTVYDEVSEQHLDKYEAEQDFKPVWLELDKLIELNEGILTQKGTQINTWVYRETLALRKLKEANIMKYQ